VFCSYSTLTVGSHVNRGHCIMSKGRERWRVIWSLIIVLFAVLIKLIINAELCLFFVCNI